MHVYTKPPPNVSNLNLGLTLLYIPICGIDFMMTTTHGLVITRLTWRDRQRQSQRKTYSKTVIINDNASTGAGRL